MEYSGEDWVSLDKYMTKHGKFSVDKARLIIKEVITALLSLKKLGVLHGDIAGQNILYNDKTGNVKLIDFGVSEPLEEGNQDSSGSGSSEDESYFWNIEKSDMNDIGKLMYYLLTSKDPFKDKTISRGGVAKKLRNSLDDPESQSAIDAVDLRMYILGSAGGVINGEADLDQRWLDGAVEHESMGTRHDNRADGSTVS
ncbi:hypothetical protein BASA62_007404 [Batrachochytrium salamandrivorans]|nr:hypothetical protein BASA62_007404 [Batrachochytrium salamandrivorans]